MEMHFGCLQCKCQGHDLPLMRWYAGRLCFGATCPVRGKEKKTDVLLFECWWECIQRAAISFHFLIHMYSSAPCPGSSPASGRVCENYTQDKMKWSPEHETSALTLWSSLCINLFCDLFFFLKSLFCICKKYWINKLHLLTLHFFPV